MRLLVPIVNHFKNFVAQNGVGIGFLFLKWKVSLKNFRASKSESFQKASINSIWSLSDDVPVVPKRTGTRQGGKFRLISTRTSLHQTSQIIQLLGQGNNVVLVLFFHGCLVQHLQFGFAVGVAPVSFLEFVISGLTACSQSILCGYIVSLTASKFSQSSNNWHPSNHDLKLIRWF